MKTHKILMLHCQKVKHLYICNISKTVQNKIWQVILQDNLVTEGFMVYSNNRISQGYNVVEKSKQNRIISFNGIKLVAQK